MHEGKKGLWVNPAPVPPWVSRKANWGQSLHLLDMVPLEGRSFEHCILYSLRNGWPKT